MTRDHERSPADAVRLAATDLWRQTVDERLDRIERFIFWTLCTAVGGLASIVLTLIATVFVMMREGR